MKKTTIYQQFDHPLLREWVRYGGSPISAWLGLHELKRFGKVIYPDFGIQSYTLLVAELSNHDRELFNSICIYFNNPNFLNQ